MLRLRNPIRRYDWGSTTAIPTLLGTPPDGGPQAELWLGAHPDDPSALPDGQRLDDVIAQQGEAILGPRVQAAFGDRLPFLAKVLAAAAPLSLQVHPDAGQAAAGFAQEEAAAVPRDARERRYKDPFHKPEMVVALGPFDALCGWRSPAATRGLLATLAVDHPLWPHLDQLLAADDDATAIRQAVTWLLDPGSDIAALVTAVGAAAAAGEGAELETAAALARAHPGDPGVLVALLLNRVTLARGEALYLPAGNVHAYLHGTAVEVMAASDNVLRAGLTSKHVDAAELLRIVDFAPRPLPRVLPDDDGPWRRYRPGAAEFQLDWGDLDDADTWQPGPDSGPRVVLVLEGTVEVRTGAGGDTTLSTGTSAVVTAADGSVQLRGHGIAVVVSVPQGPTA